VAWIASVSAPMLRLVAPALRKRDLNAAQHALHAGLVLLVKQNQWDILTKFASTLEFIPAAEWKEKELRALVQKQIGALQATLVRALARSESLSQAAQNVQQRISSFFRKYLRVKDGSWRSHLSMAEAGAAIERGGRFTDAIGFYEAIAKDNSIGSDDKLFARQRWLRNKQRQLEYERSQGSLTKASQIEHDIKQEMAALRITVLEGIDEFPRLPALDMSAQQTTKPRKENDSKEPSPLIESEQKLAALGGLKSDPLILTTGSFKFEFSRKLQRCNIVHTETMATAFIKLKEFQCGGEVEFHRLDGGGWACTPWNLIVYFPNAEGERLVIDVEQSGVQLSVRP
jgi:hypothetical protein